MSVGEKKDSKLKVRDLHVSLGYVGDWNTWRWRLQKYSNILFRFVYYESIKRELKTGPINERPTGIEPSKSFWKLPVYFYDDDYHCIFFFSFLSTMIRMQDVVFAVYRMEWRCHAFRGNDITWEIGRIQQEWFMSEKSANMNGRLPHLCSLSLFTQPPSFDAHRHAEPLRARFSVATPQNTKQCAHVT